LTLLFRHRPWITLSGSRTRGERPARRGRGCHRGPAVVRRPAV